MKKKEVHHLQLQFDLLAKKLCKIMIRLYPIISNTTLSWSFAEQQYAFPACVDSVFKIIKDVSKRLGDHLFNLLCYFSYVFMRGNPSGRPFSVGAVIIKPGHDMDVYMWDNLVCSCSVVLPHIEAISLYSRYYCLSDSRYQRIQFADFDRRHMEQCLVMFCGHH